MEEPGRIIRLVKRPSMRSLQSVVPKKKENEFAVKLRGYSTDIFGSSEYGKHIGHMYYLEDQWTDLIGNSCMTDKKRKQQQAIWEFLITEKNYIKRIRVISEVFQQILRLAQLEGELLDVKEVDIFGNINQILIANDNIWKDYFAQMISKTRKTRRPIKPSELLSGFQNTDELYKAHADFILKQEECLNKIREYSDIFYDPKKEESRKCFKIYLSFCEELPQCERLKLVDLMTEPMQRMTRYPLLLGKIHDYTENVQEKKQLKSIRSKFEGYNFDINKRRREMLEKEKLEEYLDQFEHYNTWLAGSEDVMWVAVDFLRGNILTTKEKEPRCILKHGSMRMIEKKQETLVEALLFTDCLVITRRRNSTKKLVILKQLFFLDKVRFIKSEVSSNSIVFLYLDEHGLLASSLMLEIPEKSRDKWLYSLEKAKERYEKSLSGTGTTLEFFNDDNRNNTQQIQSRFRIILSNPIRRNVSTRNPHYFNTYGPLARKSDQNNNNSSVKRKGIDRSGEGGSQQMLEVNLRKTDSFNELDTVIHRTASWLLTDEKKIRSIRSLLREDLWGNPDASSVSGSSSKASSTVTTHPKIIKKTTDNMGNENLSSSGSTSKNSSLN